MAEKIRILLVDNNEEFRDELEHFLKRRGYDIETADDGEGVPERLRDGDFQVLITDNNMERINGLQVLYRLRNDPELKDIPIFVIFISADPRAEKAVKDSGARFFFKPVAFEEVLDLIRQINKTPRRP